MCVYANEKRSGNGRLEFHAVRTVLQHGVFAIKSVGRDVTSSAWYATKESLTGGRRILVPPCGAWITGPRLAVSCRPLGRGDSCQAAAIRVGGVRVPAWNPPPLSSKIVTEHRGPRTGVDIWNIRSTSRCYFANMEIHFSSYSFLNCYIFETVVFVSFIRTVFQRPVFKFKRKDRRGNEIKKMAFELRYTYNTHYTTFLFTLRIPCIRYTTNTTFHCLAIV